MAREKEPPKNKKEVLEGAMPRERGPAPEKPAVQAERAGGDLLKGGTGEKFSWKELRHAPSSESRKIERGKFSWEGLTEMLETERKEKEEERREEERSKFSREFIDSVVEDVPWEGKTEDELAVDQIEEGEKRLAALKRELEIKMAAVGTLDSYLKQLRHVFIEKPRRKE